MEWKRPLDVPAGQVWSRFDAKGQDGRPGKNYQIRDMGEEDRKQCLDMMQDIFLRDEPLSRVLNIQSDSLSVATIRSNWESYVDQGISVACYTEENGAPRDLVGFNILIVRSMEDEDEDIESVKGEAWRKLLRTLVTAEQMVDIFKQYGVDKYLTSSGLAVVPEYRGQNIGARIIEVREAICKAYGIKAVSTVFTARSSQILAAKCGYQVLAELPYEHMLQYGADFRGCSTPSALVMGTKFN